MKTSRSTISTLAQVELKKQLISAIENAKYDEVVRLIQLGVNIRVPNQEGDTPLHIAVIAGDIEMMELLISNKADVNAQNQYGYTPLYFACIREISEFLIKSKANINTQTEHGETPLHRAASRGNIEVIESLIQHNSNVNAKDINGCLVLDYTATPVIIQKLLELGGDAD